MIHIEDREGLHLIDMFLNIEIMILDEIGVGSDWGKVDLNGNIGGGSV